MSADNGVRVMLVDDHPLMRRGVREVLEELAEFEVVAEASGGEEAVARAAESRPDVILMDVMMPDKDGVEACRDIMELLPDTKVLMLTASTRENAVIEAVAAGAAGFVHKFSGSEEMVDAVRRVADGRMAVPDDAVRRVFGLIRGGPGATPGPRVLTDRQRDVVALFAMGRSYAQMAEALGVSSVTARNALYRVQDKLGLQSKQEIVVWAVRNGLLDAED
ncbi:MAG: response regulator transcription factor [Chloroflexota bacterium]|nr:response regulator transcription factor [Chloroflexota bacterium]MDE2883887.1 response regulator transcription factor [Chloroflexota bacterium]